MWWEHCEVERRWRLLWRGEAGQSHSEIYKDGQPNRGEQPFPQGNTVRSTYIRSKKKLLELIKLHKLVICQLKIHLTEIIDTEEQGRT
jgi:hypothetical protein